MSWFANHPKWLYDESVDLSTSIHYVEKYQEIGRTLISHGEMLVRKEKTYCYPILIAYPDATPFVPPIVFLLKELLTHDDIVRLSSIVPDKISEELSSKVTHHDRRHQNPDGSVCFVEMGDLHGGHAESYPIRDIFSRLRAWLAGSVPLDSPEAELFFHFTSRAEDERFLLPDNFYNSVELIKGDFAFVGFPRGFNVGKTIWLGTAIIGESAAGITLPPKTAEDRFSALFSMCKEKPIQIIKKAQNNENSNEGLVGFWWDISLEPQPFKTMEGLAEIFSKGDFESGFKILLGAQGFRYAIEKLHPKIYVGLRFPGRKGGRDWLLLCLNKGSRPPILKIDDTEWSERIQNYSLKALSHEAVTESEFHKRNRGRADRNSLKQRQICSIGCGALGSEIVDCLAKAGIGSLNLVDKDFMRVQNSIRHILGIEYTGIAKTIGLYLQVLLHNPFVITQNFSCDITRRDIKEYFPDGYVGVSTIADDNVEAFLNEQAIEAGRTIFYSRVLRGGKAARIFRVIAGKDACKECLSRYRDDKNKGFINIEEDPDLPPITNECNNPIRPASAADIKAIAGITGRIILDWLAGRHEESNHWVLTTEPLPSAPTVGGEFQLVVKPSFLPPHPECCTCGGIESHKCLIQKKVYDYIHSEAEASGSIETGGILLGYIENIVYHVMDASGPGSNAVRTATRFERDINHCQREIHRVADELGKDGLYLGEWHYHPAGNNSPSAQDMKSLMEIASQEEYRIKNPISIILSSSGECAITIHDKNGRCSNITLEIAE
ncbi:MAG: ThiF family adenylyltransferase [Proteobacteria bacterium]|nr:ThiF family adenylyltransferase [Pseudomonadota bacterium]